MKKKRAIIYIDEEKCTGCGNCITACAEGALKLIDGKARLVSEIYCDGIGACMGTCPEGALTITERVAEEFDEQSVKENLHDEHLHKRAGHQATLACGCPSSAMMRLDTLPDTQPQEKTESRLMHWPIKLQLLPPDAPFLMGADLLLLADCAAAAYSNLHQHLLGGRAVAMGCPKLDDLDSHIDRLTAILRSAKLRSLTVVHMEVPCCKAFVHAAREAIDRAGIDIELRHIMISRKGEILEDNYLNDYSPVAVKR